jgi:hypothetical protein
MKDHLHILLSAASRTQSQTPAPPLGLEARVLASWRERLRSADANWMAAFRPAFLLAGVIAAVSVALNLGAFVQLGQQSLERETEWSLAEYTYRLAADR